MKIRYLLVFTALSWSLGTQLCVAQSVASRAKVLTVAFYNVENLFDTEDDPDKRDDSPAGDRWNDSLYHHKLGQLASVIAQIGDTNGPEILGVSEVENERVLRDLVATGLLAGFGYTPLLVEGPDRRSVDVGLIYKADVFTPIDVRSVAVKRPEDPDFATRDILFVTGTLPESDTLTVVVNHWPSRRAPSSFREMAAAVARQGLDSILAVRPQAKIVLMGDFNDDPINKSIKKVIGASWKRDKLDPGQFYNPLGVLFKQGQGSLAYRGAWNLFDQLIISPGLYTGTAGYVYRDESAAIHAARHMFNTEGQYAGYPFRSFAGGRYLGGYSDHLPVYLYLERAP